METPVFTILDTDVYLQHIIAFTILFIGSFVYYYYEFIVEILTEYKIINVDKIQEKFENIYGDIILNMHTKNETIQVSKEPWYNPFLEYLNLRG
jgi:hypothetical protein